MEKDGQLISRATRKCQSKALQAKPIFDIACYIASHRNVALPNSAEALHTLEMASPRPGGGLNVRVRQWPLTPTADVSVIVPCYNEEQYVRQCIESIATQESDYSFEIIAVDDGSTDNTGAILDEMACKWPSIRVIHQDNLGFSGARNTGLACISGGGVVFVDSDDMLVPGAIDRLAKAYEQGGCDYVTASFDTMDEDGTHVEHATGPRHHGGPVARLYSREIWRRLEFPEGYWFEDTVQAYCIAPKWREKYIDVPVYLRRRNRSSITFTSRRSKKALDTLWIVEEMLQWDEELGIPIGQELFEQTLLQFGPLLFGRTDALSRKEIEAAFVYASDQLNERMPENRFHTERGGHWPVLEKVCDRKILGYGG